MDVIKYHMMTHIKQEETNKRYFQSNTIILNATLNHRGAVTGGVSQSDVYS